jgi:hypothetical protein
MAQAASTNQPGLWLSPSPLGDSAPDGALAVADNCVIRYAGILESRRGFGVQSSQSGFISLGAFGSNLVGATSSKVKAFFSSAWHDIADVSLGTLPGPYPLPQFFTSRGALYATDGQGLQRTGAIGDSMQLAGLIRAAPFTAASLSLFASGTGVGIPDGSAVAYVVVYQRSVFNGADELFSIVSPPSAPMAIKNTSGNDRAIQLIVPLGPQVVVGDIVQIYRTVAAASGIPSNEYFLVQSFPANSAAIVAKSFTFVDGVPDAFLGAALYTNQSQEGAAQENDAPPKSADVCQFLGTTIYANTVGYFSMALRLVAGYVDRTGSAVPISNGLQVGDILTFTVNGTPVAFVAGTDFATNTALWDVAGYIVQSLADALNANSTTHAAFQASAYQTAETILLEAVSPLVIVWTLAITSTKYAIPIGGIVQQASPTAEVTPTTTTPGPLGEIVQLSAVGAVDNNFPEGAYVVTAATGLTFQYTNPKSPTPAPGTASTTAYTWQNAYPWNAWVVTGKHVNNPGVYKSDNGADLAGLSFSKFQQPEAVPLENSLTVGNPTYPIVRVIPLRQSVLIFKQGDGIWQLVGTGPSDFRAVPYDLTTQIAYPWSAAALDDNVCFVSTKGPAGVNESGGVFPLAPPGYDCPIREQILDINSLTSAKYMFGVGYESEKCYILWTPTVTGDTTSTEAWVFSLATRAWTRWPLPAVTGFVDALNTNALIYTDGATVFQERKTYTSADYQDGADSTISISAVASPVTSGGATTVVLSTASTTAIGDRITKSGAVGWVISRVAGVSATLIGVTGTFTTGTATRQVCVPCTVTRLPLAGVDGNPGLAHRFQEVAYNFRQFVAPWLQINQTTSLNPNNGGYPYNVYPSTNGYGVNMRAGIAPDNVQAILLQTGFTHAAALCNFQLQSTSLTDEPVSGRTAGG